MPTPKPKPREARLVGDIAAHIRNQILSGELLPADRLRESKLARTLGTSRAPIREAARLLERDGLLKFEANRGFSVRQPTAQELIDVSGLRAAIERYAVRHAALSKGRRQLVATVKLRMADIMRFCEAGDREQQTNADFFFHRAIIESTGNARVISAFDRIAVELRMTLQLMGFAAADWKLFAESHGTIIDVLRRGSPGECEDAIEEHVNMALDETIEAIRRRTDRA